LFILLGVFLPKVKKNYFVGIRTPWTIHSEETWEVITFGAESQQVHVMGTGILLMKAEIFKGLTLPPFSELILNDGTYRRIPVQDAHFVFRCTVESGAKLWLDTTIKAQHIDYFPIDRTYKRRFKDKKGDKQWTPKRDMIGAR